MDRREKSRLKAEIGKYIDLRNGRFTDSEVERLHELVEKRDQYDGASRTYRNSYKSFDSEDTYHVEESDTYTLHSDASGIHIDRDFKRDWDDGQKDREYQTIDTGRGILRLLGKLNI